MCFFSEEYNIDWFFSKEFHILVTFLTKIRQINFLEK